VAIFFVLGHEKIESQVAQRVTALPKKNVNPVSSQKHAQVVQQANKQASWDMAAVKPISLTTLADAVLHRNDYSALGELYSTDLGMKVNIYAGVGNTVLNLGAGTLKQNDVMGQENYALAGHNMDDGRTFFSPVYTAAVRKKLKGKVIAVTDWHQVYHYRVIAHRFVPARSLYLADNTLNTQKQPILTLFTCDWTGRGRLYVQATLAWTTAYRA
jgi:sortase A